MTQSIYIMGTGRSGSTVLEILLSENDDVCSVGELTHIFEDGFEGDKPCACGARFSRCEFWSRVQERLSYSPGEFRQYSNLFNSVDWHKGFLKLIFGSFSKKDLDAYKQINRQLYDSCTSVSGKKIIVDSSKYPARAIMLHKIYDTSAKIICLTRSPEGLLEAFQKTGVEQPAKSPFTVFAYYVYVLLCCRLVALRTNNVLFITFETLKAHPVETINRLETFTGIAFEQTKRNLEDNIAFTPGHIITGNRLRNENHIFFKKQPMEQKPAPRRHKLILFLMKIFQKLLGF